MPLILSLTQDADGDIWAIGPEGLFHLRDGELYPQPQPDAHPACCAITDGYLLVGGETPGVARRLADGSWEAGWLDGVSAQVACLAPDPNRAHSGVVLAGAAGGGVLRSANHGRHWSVCNFGLTDFELLCLVWAPVQPAGQWPPLEVVFAGTANGVHRSPNGGRGWKQSVGPTMPVLALAISPNYHAGGPVLAGTEGAGIWCSDDGGHTFSPVAGSPPMVNALVALPDGWLLSDHERIWRSADGQHWHATESAEPAFTLLVTRDAVLAGGMQGVTRVA